MFAMGDALAAPKAAKLSDTEFFCVPDLPKIVTPSLLERPWWFIDWLSADKLATDFVVYAESWSAVELFAELQSQWRFSFDAITGLDYAAVVAVIGLQVSHKTTQRQLFDDIQALEIGAMAAFNQLAEQRKADNQA